MRNNNIVIPDSQFNYENLHLADPISIQGGSFYKNNKQSVSLMSRPV